MLNWMSDEEKNNTAKKVLAMFNDKVGVREITPDNTYMAPNFVTMQPVWTGFGKIRINFKKYTVYFVDTKDIKEINGSRYAGAILVVEFGPRVESISRRCVRRLYIKEKGVYAICFADPDHAGPCGFSTSLLTAIGSQTDILWDEEVSNRDALFHHIKTNRNDPFAKTAEYLDGWAEEFEATNLNLVVTDDGIAFEG